MCRTKARNVPEIPMYVRQVTLNSYSIRSSDVNKFGHGSPLDGRGPVFFAAYPSCFIDGPAVKNFFSGPADFVDGPARPVKFQKR